MYMYMFVFLSISITLCLCFSLSLTLTYKHMWPLSIYLSASLYPWQRSQPASLKIIEMFAGLRLRHVVEVKKLWHPVEKPVKLAVVHKQLDSLGEQDNHGWVGHAVDHWAEHSHVDQDHVLLTGEAELAGARDGSRGSDDSMVLEVLHGRGREEVKTV